VNAAPWVYLPPLRPESHPDQCYYRALRWLHMQLPGAAHADTTLTLYRDVRGEQAELTVNIQKARVSIDLDRAALTLLRDALNDVLQDIEPFEADRERQESFDRIQEEMRDDDERGGASACYYAHPDIHYVHPDRVTDEVRRLEAAGVKRYMVIPDPAIVDAEFEPDSSSEVAGRVAEELQGQAS
jgi:hypothetical protein